MQKINNDKPTYLSEHLNIDKTEFEKLGVFNPIINLDTRLCTQPTLLKTSSNPIIRNSYQTYQKFFALLLFCLKESKHINDLLWQGAKNMTKFPEYQFTCIGYSKNSTAGRGTEFLFDNNMLLRAKNIITLAYDNPDIFLILPLIQENIAGDRISDMLQNIIDEDICKYTVDMMSKLNIKGNFIHHTKNDNSYNLLFNPYSKIPIKLIPVDILTNLPIADDVGKFILNKTKKEESLKKIANYNIANIWKQGVQKQKEDLLNEAKINDLFLIELCKVLSQEVSKPYNIKKDVQGRYRWLEDSKKIKQVELPKPQSKNNYNDIGYIEKVVTNIIMHFKEQIDLGYSKMFWSKENNKNYHVLQDCSNSMFCSIAKSWLEANHNEITIIKNENIFSFSTLFNENSVNVSLKHSSSSSLTKDYQELLEKSKNFKNVKSCFIVLNFKDKPSPNLKKVLKNQQSECKIFQINILYDNKPNEFYSNIAFENKLIDIDYRSKGGKHSYGAYRPLQSKVEELCQKELDKNINISANKLCNIVSNIILNNHIELLEPFQPFKNHKLTNEDWKKPTFYNWCNDFCKVYKATKEDILV